MIDDLITYRLGDEEFLVVPNAANIDNDFAAMSERLGNFDVKFVNESDDTSLIAVQGPRAEEICLRLVPQMRMQYASSNTTLPFRSPSPE